MSLDTALPVRVNQSPDPSARPFTIRDYPGSFSEYTETLWWMYRAMTDGRIVVQGRPVRSPGEPTPDGRNSSFWHVITQQDKDGMRCLEPRRMAALPLAWDLLERLGRNAPSVSWWREKGGRLLVTPADHSLVVCLNECRRALYLVSFYPASSGTVRRLERKDAQARQNGRCRRSLHEKWSYTPTPSAAWEWAVTD